MSIAEAIKTEILFGGLKKTCCRLAFLSGAIRGAGSLTISCGVGFVIECTSEKLIEKFAEIIQEDTALSEGIEVIGAGSAKKQSGKAVFVLKVEGAPATEALKNAGILSPQGELTNGIPNLVKQSACCAGAFSAGLFCASGSLFLKDGEANSGGYFLELSVADDTVRNDFSECLKQNGIILKSRAESPRRLYAKGFETIADFVQYIGAQKAFFELQDLFLLRSAKNEAQRQSNCDTGNLARAIDASTKQLVAINLISKRMKGGLQALPKDLYILAKTRLENPESSSKEIVELSNTALTKSGFNHRMRRLIEIGESLKS
ncbi:MAG: DNA-binding protein WhiA [Firmicutes bacterium]|nr:DNA-binding protein WhiA [Bacillota bacterium]